MMLRKTKIICTLGPAVDNEDMIRALIRTGMNAARFNFSHGSHEEHLNRLNLLKSVRDSMGRPVASILDTKGPEIRIRSFETKSISLEAGDAFTLTTREVQGNGNLVSVTYPELHKEVSVGQEILIDDGLVALKVEEIDGQDIRCTVENGGTLSANKSINIPGVHIHLPALTEKDVSDIQFGVENDFDFIAASFVRRAADVQAVREVLDRFGGQEIRIIAKIENQEGVDNIDEILEAADGIMVARGDLGVEIPAAKVPILQKQIIRKGLQAGKPVITATQMLDSMMRNPRPTRAEVTDVANAVYDGTDAVMLSGETAMGKYPVEALSMMAQICESTEKYLDYNSYRKRKVSAENEQNISNAVCYSSVSTAHALNAKAIIAPSISGFTTRMLSKWRPGVQIIGLSPSASAVRQMQIYWGVRPFQAKRAESTDVLIWSSLELLKNKGILEEGDVTVVTAGVVSRASRHEPAANTNIMRVVVVD